MLICIQENTLPPTLVVNSNTPAALTPKRLFIALGLCVLAVLLVLAIGGGRPGDPVQQLAGAFGTSLLLVPVYFSWHKRVGGAQKPRAWFVAHVLASLLGAVFIVAHLRGGSLLSPPGLAASALAFLVLQGVFARATLGREYARLFARASQSFTPVSHDRQVLAALIERKVELLKTLDAAADEGLFSLQWQHWAQSPLLSFRFAVLARQERGLVHAGIAVSPVLCYWRLLHLLAACVFVFGLVAHVIVVLFFAGYAAGADAPYWWYVTAWGAGQ